MSANIAEMERRRAAAELGGGQNRIDAQHAKGKLTARERLDVLLDEGSFEELDRWLSRKVGRIEGYQFSVERRDANPRTGTSKTWFHREYGIPAYTFEVGDEADRNATIVAAREFARALPSVIFGSQETHKGMNDDTNPEC